VKRNIERPEVAKDTKLKAYVQSEIEKEIAVAIQKGTLQSKNWDLVPLIALPVENSKATAFMPASQSPPPPPEHNRYTQQQSYGGSTYRKNNASVASTNYNGNNASSDSYYGPAASFPASDTAKNYGDDNVQTSGSYYGPGSSHHNTPVHNFQQLHSSSKNNNNSFSSSPFVGKNKNGKRQRYQQQQQQQQQQVEEEDFIPFGHYGPSGSASPDSNSSSPDRGNKKAKKKHRKNKFGAVSTKAMGTMHNNGMDHSHQAMAKRANRFSGRGGIHEATIANSRCSNGVYGNHKDDKYMGKGTIGGTKATLDETDFEQMTVKGTSTTLEKEYLRLTAPPRAEFVRPFGILKQHLRNLQNEYYRCPGTESVRDDRNATTMLQDRMKTPQVNWRIVDRDGVHDGVKDSSQICRRQHDYLWFCSQLKAIRQDCTVQRIQGDLAVDVYETHARIALQEGDLNE
jgi:hypothetical protein